MRQLITLIFILYSLTLYGQKTENSIEMDTVYAKHSADGWYLTGIHGPSYRNCNGKHCNGLLVDTFQNGQIKECAFYINGQIRGPYIEYYINGQVKEIGATDSSGNRIGNLYSYFPNGQLEHLASFKNGYRIKAQYFFESGKQETSLEIIEINNLALEKYYFEFNEKGDTLSGTVLVDSVSLIQKYWTRYDNGKLEMKGYLKSIPTKHSRIQIGTWYYYDKKGKLIKKETLDKG